MAILVSACLLGLACRYDGQSKPNANVMALLSEQVLIPMCPEQLGGLPTPRSPSERCGECVCTCDGRDVTAAYQRGAEQAVHLAHLFGCRYAILKACSPACGCGEIYDGSFTGTRISGNGVTAELLLQHGIAVFNEEQLAQLRRVLLPC